MAFSLTGFAFAHEHDHDGYGSRSAIEYGYHNGYLDGFQRGREDRRAGVGYRFKSRDYDHAMRGYEHYMGSDDQYEEGYRRGYVAGYNDSFRGREARFMAPLSPPPYGDAMAGDDSGPGYGRQSVAFQVGYRGGLIAGGKDRRENQ